MPKREPRRNPIENFPLKPRKDGRFQKRINGLLYYFGADGDRPGAMREYEGVKEDLYAGRKPKVEPDKPGGPISMTMADVARRFLEDRKGLIEDGTWRQHRRALKRFAKWTGHGRAAIDLTPDDFSEYGRRLRKRLGPYAYNRERAAILAALNHADAQSWIDRAPKLGAGFKRSPKSKLRATRKPRLLAGADVNAVLGMSGPNIFGMILLALNGGFGAEDCAALPWASVDLERAVIAYARTKNNIPRTVPLWPETLESLRVLRAKRPADAMVFRTKAGAAWKGHAIAHAFRRAWRACALPVVKGVGLGACRHTFATYANEVRDTDARRHLMGRLLPGLDDIYVETLFHGRLQAVVNHVRDKLSIGEVVGHRGKVVATTA